MSLWRVVIVTGICCATVLVLGAINIWIGALSLPIVYSIQKSLLTK
jgi:hypothetical protein